MSLLLLLLLRGLLPSAQLRQTQRWHWAVQQHPRQA
jgi:hypothetical protein